MIEYKETIKSFSLHNDLLKDVDFYDFMNHGYSPYSKLVENYKLRYWASLYLKILDNIETKDKTLLDVGCGRGGGIALYKKFYNLKEINACDITDKNIDYCKQKHKGINFKVCNAENLIYADNQFDIVTNVESMCYYKNKKQFLLEVKRVLKKDGIFICTDCNKEVFESFYKNRSMFSFFKVEDILDNVNEACYKTLEDLKKWPDSKAKDLTKNILEGKIKKYGTNQDCFNIYTVNFIRP